MFYNFVTMTSYHGVVNVVHLCFVVNKEEDQNQNQLSLSVYRGYDKRGKVRGSKV
jgi:hypothetical protein